MKEKLINTFGTFGLVLFYAIQLFISILPFIMIDVGFLATFLLILLEMFIPLTTIVFWIWGLVCAIQGVQDVLAIIYYVVFAVACIPFFINTICTAFQKN